MEYEEGSLVTLEDTFEHQAVMAYLKGEAIDWEKIDPLALLHLTHRDGIDGLKTEVFRAVLKSMKTETERSLVFDTLLLLDDQKMIHAFMPRIDASWTIDPLQRLAKKYHRSDLQVFLVGKAAQYGQKIEGREIPLTCQNIHFDSEKKLFVMTATPANYQSLVRDFLSECVRLRIIDPSKKPEVHLVCHDLYIPETVQVLRTLESGVVLKTLDLAHNYPNLEDAQALATALLQHKNLTSLILRETTFTPMGAQPFPEPDDNTLMKEVAQILGSALSELVHLTGLTLRFEAIDSEAAPFITEALSKLSELTSLDLSRSAFDSSGFMNLASTLSKLTKLTFLNLAFTRLSEESADAIGSALSNLRNLSHLNLSGNNLSGKGIQDLASAFPHLSHLDYLGFQYSGIDPERMKIMAPFLGQLLSLQSLDLSTNFIGPDGAKALSENLHHLINLRSLQLGSNGIGLAGARALASPLAELKQLESLGLRFNSLGKEGAQVIEAALRKQTPSPSLEISGNSLDPSDPDLTTMMTNSQERLQISFS